MRNGEKKWLKSKKEKVLFFSDFRWTCSVILKLGEARVEPTPTAFQDKRLTQPVHQFHHRDLNWSKGPNVGSVTYKHRFRSTEEKLEAGGTPRTLQTNGHRLAGLKILKESAQPFWLRKCKYTCERNGRRGTTRSPEVVSSDRERMAEAIYPTLANNAFQTGTKTSRNAAGLLPTWRQVVVPCRAPWGRGACSSPGTPRWYLWAASLRWPLYTAGGAPWRAPWWKPSARGKSTAVISRPRWVESTQHAFRGVRHLAEEISELLLSLDDLLPVLDLLVLNVFLLQPANTHSKRCMGRQA